ncbi:MAG: hypothetical protein ACRD4F_08190, partial [Candidatus Angelobacter sp.]
MIPLFMPASITKPSFLLDYCRRHQSEMLTLLQRMVELESPSDDKGAIDQLGKFLGNEFSSLGGAVSFAPQNEAGNHLKVEFPGLEAKPILLLG